MRCDAKRGKIAKRRRGSRLCTLKNRLVIHDGIARALRMNYARIIRALPMMANYWYRTGSFATTLFHHEVHVRAIPNEFSRTMTCNHISCYHGEVHHDVLRTTKYKFVSSWMNSGGISSSQSRSLASHKQTHTDGLSRMRTSCSMRSNSHSCSIRYALRRRSTTSSYNLRTVVALVCNSVPAVGVQPSGSPVASFGFMSRGCESR